MHTIDARALDFQALNQQLREGGDACAIINCCGSASLPPEWRASQSQSTACPAMHSALI